AALLGGAEDGLGVEVALGRRPAPEGVRLVGQADVEGIPIEVGEHGDARDAHLAAGADDPHRNLPAIGDENLAEHEGSMVSASIGTSADSTSSIPRTATSSTRRAPAHLRVSSPWPIDRQRVGAG